MPKHLQDYLVHEEIPTQYHATTRREFWATVNDLTEMFKLHYVQAVDIAIMKLMELHMYSEKEPTPEQLGRFRAFFWQAAETMNQPKP